MKKSKVLVVDDESGLAAFRADRPDLVSLDGHLPDMDGLDVCRGLPAFGSCVETMVGVGYVLRAAQKGKA